MAESASGTEGHISDGSLKEKFEEFNKKYNAKGMETVHMSYRSFKHMTNKIECLKKLTEFDFFPIFDKYSTKGTECKYVEYQHFDDCLRELAKMEAQKTSGLKEPSHEAVEDSKQRIYREITDLGNVGRKAMDTLTAISDAHDMINSASNITGKALVQIAGGTADYLAAVGTSVQYIGPIIELVKGICERIAACKAITEKAQKFTLGLHSLSTTLEFIQEFELYKSSMMRKNLEKLGEYITEGHKILDKIDKHGRHKVVKFMTVKRDEKKLRQIAEEVDSWLQKCFHGGLAEIMKKVGENQEILGGVAEGVTKNQEMLGGVAEGVAEVKDIVKGIAGQDKSPTRVMDEAARSALQSCRPSIMENLDVQLIIPHLDDGILNDDEEKQLIEHEMRTPERASKLLDIIAKKEPAAFDKFVSALRKAEYAHLAEELRGAKVNNEVRAKLIAGGVPPRPNAFVNRPEIIEKIHEAFSEIKDEPGWVCMHGMGGSGKTTIAAESVRDAKVLCEYFPDGVFWASIGVMDDQNVLSKMQTLCALIDKERSKPGNIEEAKGRLRSIFLHQHPRSLLILDDVWSQSVAKEFDYIQCRILVTTRDLSVMEGMASKAHPVEMDTRFREEQAMELFSKLTGVPVEEIPPQAIEIYKEVGGSPMAISMIGAFLKDHPDPDWWQYCLGQLTGGKFISKEMTTKYQYKSIKKAIGISVTNLDDDLRELYQDFAVFVDDVKVPTGVLEVLWNEDKFSVEITMLPLVKKSLAQREKNDVYNTYLYSLHDLQLDYLKETNKEKLPQIHQKLIERYKDKCNGDFSNLPDDKYIHWFIGYHFHKSGLNDLMAKVYLDLKFIESVLKVTGPAHFITDFHKYSTNIIGGNQELERDHKVFLDFLKSSAYTFAEKGGDIIQLALCQPSDTKVFKQAKEIAIERRGKGVKYFEWCNNRGTSTATYLTTRLHKRGVSCATLSPDRIKILSSGGDNTVNMVKISNSLSGKELLSLDARNGRIRRVVYSPDNKHIITSSYANTKLKLFLLPENMLTTAKGDKADNVHSKKEILETFLVHEFEMSDQALTLKFSHDGKYLAAGCEDGRVYIWEMDTKDLVQTFQSDKCTAADCDFTDDNLSLAAGTSDGVLYFNTWSVTDGKQVYRAAQEIGYYVNRCSLQAGTHKVAYFTLGKIHYCDFESDSCEEFATSYGCESITHSPDGNFLAASDMRGSVKVWDTRNGKLVGEFQSPSDVNSLSFSPDSKRLVLGGHDGTITIWDVKTTTTGGGLRPDFDALIRDDSLIIAARDRARRLNIFRDHEADIIYQSEPESSYIECVAMSNDWSKVSYGCDDGTLKVLQLNGENDVSVKNFDGHTRAIRCCRYNAKGDLLATASEDETLRLWSNDGSSMVCEGHTGGVAHCAFFDHDTKLLSSPGRTSIFSSFDDYCLRVWDVKSAKCLFTCNTGDWTRSCDVSYDSTKIVSCSEETLPLFDGKTGDRLHTLPRPDEDDKFNWFTCCRYAKDGLLASGHKRGNIYIWNTERDGEKHPRHLGKHNSAVWDIKWSGDSKRLVSVSEDSIKWWDCNGSVLQTFYITGGWETRISTSDDFKTFVTIDKSGILYILREI